MESYKCRTNYLFCVLFTGGLTGEWVRLPKNIDEVTKCGIIKVYGYFKAKKRSKKNRGKSWNLRK